MKIVLTFKCPDVVDDAITNEGIDEDSADTVRKVCGLFVEYGEYVRIEIDSEAKTAEVLRV